MSGIEVPASAEVIVAEVFDDFRQMREINTMLGEYAFIGAASYERDELAASVAEKILGLKVRITEHESAKRTYPRPIVRCSATNPRQLGVIAKGHAPFRRTYPGTTQEYLPQDFFRYRKKANGEVVGIDATRASLVVKPRGPLGFFDRCWVEPVSQYGEPQVNIRLLEK
jgi:hypothetical protein